MNEAETTQVLWPGALEEARSLIQLGGATAARTATAELPVDGTHG